MTVMMIIFVACVACVRRPSVSFLQTVLTLTQAEPHTEPHFSVVSLLPSLHQLEDQASVSPTCFSASSHFQNEIFICTGMLIYIHVPLAEILHY